MVERHGDWRGGTWLLKPVVAFVATNCSVQSEEVERGENRHDWPSDQRALICANCRE